MSQGSILKFLEIGFTISPYQRSFQLENLIKRRNYHIRINECQIMAKRFCPVTCSVICTAGRYTINRPKVCCLMHRTHSALCVGHASILPIPFNKKLVSVPPASHVNVRAVHTGSLFYFSFQFLFLKQSRQTLLTSSFSLSQK